MKKDRSKRKDMIDNRSHDGENISSSGLSLDNLKIHKAKPVKNICSGAPKRSTIGIMGNQRKPMNSFSRGYHG